jgi:hypothetical protein
LSVIDTTEVSGAPADTPDTTDQLKILNEDKQATESKYDNNR